MRDLRWWIVGVVVGVGLAGVARADDQGTLVPAGVKARWRPLHDRAQERILSRTRVRPPSKATVERMVQQPGNREAAGRGRKLLGVLVKDARKGTVTRGVRPGYSSTDVEFKGKNVAARLGLKVGEAVTWNTRAARVEVKAETSGRVSVVARPHDHYLGALRGAVQRIVAKIAADPGATLTAKEQQRLAMAPPDLRAEAMAQHGYKLRREPRGKQLKYELEVAGEQALRVFAVVFGPSVSTYLPGRGHSQYIHRGMVFDPYFAELESLRPTNKPVYPVALSVKEAGRMDELQRAILNSSSYDAESVQGYGMGHGRPKGYWPPRPKDNNTGNTCTTTHHRAPVGARLKQYTWLDELDRSGLVNGSVLAEVSQVRGQIRLTRIDELAGVARGKTAEQLKQLRTIVEHYNTLGLTEFPLTLLGRKQLKDLMGVPFNPKRAGTTDPVGPGFARPMYSSAPARVPVVVKLKR